jgi:hypothetical protein
MWVYLDGPALIASSVSAYLFDISLNAPVGTPVVATNQWTQITVPADTVGPTVTEFGVWGSFLSAWTGTIYVDDITLR